MDDLRVSASALSKEERIEHVQETVLSKWVQSYVYHKGNAVDFQSTPPPSAKQEGLFQIYLFYMTLLFEELLHRESTFITDTTIKEELSHWDDEGGLCIYMSVLLYGLIEQDDVLDVDDLMLVQGYNAYQSNNPFVQAIFNNPEFINFHVWLSYKGSVIDISVAQERESYQFEGKEYILGEIPEGFKMVGFIETKETVHKYMENFSSRIGMSVNEWLLFHKTHGLKSVKKALERFSK